MEIAVQPLLQFVLDIEKIDFDDDISLLLTSIIKGNKGLTDTVKQLFPLTPKIHEKYKGVFGNLQQTINCLLYYGKDWLAEDQERIKILYDMAVGSMFYGDRTPLIKSTNSDGCFVLQSIFITFAGSDYFNLNFEEALSKTLH